MKKTKNTFLSILAVLILALPVMAEDLPPALNDTEDDRVIIIEAKDPSDTVTGSESETDSEEETSESSSEDSITTESDDNSETSENNEGFKDFDDVSVDHPFYNAIIVLRHQGLIEGYDDNSFKPDKPLNRVEALKLVFEVTDFHVQAGIAPASFSDTEQGVWYSPYLNQAAYAEIIQGYPDGSFQPSRDVNTVEFLKMLLLAQKEDLSAVNMMTIPYSDVMPGQWYSKYASFAKDYDLVKTDDDNELLPDQPLTRGRAIDIIYNYRNITRTSTENDTEEETGSNSEQADNENPNKELIDLMDGFALLVNQDKKVAIQYPEIWFYSYFVEKVNEAAVTTIGFGPDDLSVSEPIVVMEFVPKDENLEYNRIESEISYYYGADETEQNIILKRNVDDFMYTIEISGSIEENERMVKMITSFTNKAEGLSSYNSKEVEVEEEL